MWLSRRSIRKAGCFDTAGKESDMSTDPYAAKNPPKRHFEGAERFNRVSPFANALISALFVILALAAFLPMVFITIISFSSEASVASIGYSFWPKSWSLDTYKYLWDAKDDVVRAFCTSLGVTVVGTCLGLILTSTMGYSLSRRTYKLKGFFTAYIFIPMLFYGGLVPTYMVNTQIYGLKNTYWALILPLACSSWYTIILRTFFQTTVPDSIIESGKMDGASQLRIFAQLVLPISLPAMATIGLFLTFAYWNDWYQAMLYLTQRQYYPLQYLLVSIERSIDFLARSADFLATETVSLPTETMRMAIVVVAVVPVACAYPFFQKYFISGLTIGAVKG